MAARLASPPVLAAPQRSAAPSPLDALTSDLAARIAAAVSPAAAVSLDVMPDDVALASAMAARLRSAGVRIVDPADGVPAVRVSCFENLRERACSAGITGSVRITLIVTTPLEGRDGDAVPRLALELRSIFSQPTRILDLAREDDDLFVLSSTALARYEQRDGSWRIDDSRPISQTRPWPRDVRGRLRVASGKVEAFLPGVSCAGNADRLTLACADSATPWPLPIENAGLDPSRNFFRTREGMAFYGAARIAGAADAGYLAATVDHTLAWVDDGRQSMATAVAGDDLVTLSVPCAAGSYVVVSSPAAEGDADLLTLFQVTGRRLVPAASPRVLAGKLTALWPGTGDAATVITHDRDRDRYDAHELVVSCSR